jgi:hypothetical protein
MLSWYFNIPLEDILVESFRAFTTYMSMRSNRRKHYRGNWKGGAVLFCLLFSAVVLLSAFFIMVERASMSHRSDIHRTVQKNLRSPEPSGNASVIMGSGAAGSTGGALLSKADASKSKHAYVTLLSGIDTSYKYRGFLYNALIMKKSLQDSGSVADFIVMVAYSNPNAIAPYQADMKLLENAGIKIHVLPRLLDNSQKLGFAEMALLKITPFSFVDYSRVQFFDGDVMPLQNMDCFFSLDRNAYTVGAVSPLNSGWYMAIPSMQAYDDMKQKALWRLGRDWDKTNGWGQQMPPGMLLRGGKNPCKNWEFNGGDMDQGLFTHYLVLNHGNVMLIDTDTKRVRVFEKGFLSAPDTKTTAKEALSCCSGKVPTELFAHFTGRSKPWMMDSKTLSGARPGSNLHRWKEYLDVLRLPVNSTNIATLGYGSPLGFWNANFPKGGFKVNPKAP